MKAAQYYGPGDIRIENIPKPAVKQNQVLVEVDWCGICGTDLHEWEGGPVIVRGKDNPHPLTGSTVPITLGHEFCGRVVDVPEPAKSAFDTDISVGDHVMVDPRINCQKCYACTSEAENICKVWAFLGLHGAGGGGFSEYVAVDAKMCYVLPKEVDLNVAALIEPLAVGRRAINESAVKDEDWKNQTVLIIGGGPIGLSTLYNLRAKGAKKIILSEPAKKRREQTQEFADLVVNPLEQNIGDVCRDETEGRGVDILFDCAGIPAGLLSGLDALKVKGWYINVAAWDKPFVLPFDKWMTKEITVRPTMAYDDRDFGDVVKDFIAGKFKGAEKMVTSRIPLKDLAQKGFEELIANRDIHMKILATPKDELLSA